MPSAGKFPQAKFRLVPEVDGLHAALMRRDYVARRQFIYHKMRPRPPRFLYKFRTLQKIATPGPGDPSIDQQSLDRLRAIIIDSHLRLSSPEEFNDPFDMGARWVVEGSAPERLNRFNSLIRQQMPSLSFKKRSEAVRHLMTAPLSDLLPVLQESFRVQRRRFGVYCFAGDPRNVLMWSHYADNHTGICLQFERTRDLIVYSRALTVDYVDEYPVINWIAGMGNALSTTFTRKHTRWRYEDERRILADGQAGRYVNVRPDSLTGLIFGCRSDENVRAAVGDILAERIAAGLSPVRVYYARQNPNCYDLDIWSDLEAPPATARPLLADLV